MPFFVNFLIFQVCLSIATLLAFPFPKIFKPKVDNFMWNFERDWISFPDADSSTRNVIRREHKLVDDKIHDWKNVKGGDSQYKYIPAKNHRQVLILDFSDAKGQKRQETLDKYTKIIKEKIPIYEDKAKVQELELSLLEKGVWAICKWAEPLPHPLDKDEQCTQGELKFLLQR